MAAWVSFKFRAYRLDFIMSTEAGKHSIVIKVRYIFFATTAINHSFNEKRGGREREKKSALVEHQ